MSEAAALPVALPVAVRSPPDAGQRMTPRIRRPTVAGAVRGPETRKSDHFGQLHRLLGGTRASEAPAGHPQFAPITLRFHSADDEESFQRNHIRRVSKMRAVRRFSAAAAVIIAVFIVADFSVYDSNPDMVVWASVARTPPLLACAFVAAVGQTAWFRENFVKTVLALMPFGFGSLGALTAVQGLLSDQEDAPSAENDGDVQGFYLTMTPILLNCGVAITVVVLQIPVRHSVPLSGVATLATLVSAAVLLDKADPVMVALALIAHSFLFPLLSWLAWDNERQARIEFLWQQQISSDSEATGVAKRLSESLLLAVLPRPIARRLTRAGDGATISDAYESVSVCFARIVCGATTVKELGMVREVIALLDDAAVACGVEKVKTTGNTFIAVAGAPFVDPRHALSMTYFGFEALGVVGEYCQTRNASVRLQIGLHTGPIVAGVIGKSRIIWDVWGDTINMASRCQSTGMPSLDRVHASRAFRDELERVAPGQFDFEERWVEIKGKGRMETAWVSAHHTEAVLDPHTVTTATYTSGSGSRGPEHGTGLDLGLSESQEADLPLLKKPLADMFVPGRLEFRDASIEAEYAQTAYLDRIASRGTETMQLLLAIAVIMAALQTVGFDDKTADIFSWGGIRSLQLFATLTAWMYHFKHPATGMAAAVVVATTIGPGTSLWLVRPEFSASYVLLEYAMLAFVSIAVSGLGLRVAGLASVPGTAIAVSSIALVAPELLGLLAVPFLGILFAGMSAIEATRIARTRFVLAKKLRLQNVVLKEQLSKAEKVLERVLPLAVIERLRISMRASSRSVELLESFQEGTILSLDIAGFTKMSSTMAAGDLVVLLNDLFSIFDDLADQHGVTKIKTVGDAYIAGNVPNNATPAVAVVRLALGIRDAVAAHKAQLQIRIGVGSGPCLAGLVGSWGTKVSYDVWGAGPERSEQMESSGAAGRVQICALTADRLRHGHPDVFELEKSEAGGWFCEPRA